MWEYYERTDRSGFRTGKAYMFKVENDGQVRLMDFQNKYPFGIGISQNYFYLLDGMTGDLERYDREGQYIDTIAKEIEIENDSDFPGFNFIENIDDRTLAVNIQTDNKIYLLMAK